MSSSALFDDLLYRCRIIDGELYYGDYPDARSGLFNQYERQNFISRILNLLLTHDFLYIRIQSLEEFIVLMGARNTLKLLQNDILRVIDDGGSVAMFLPNGSNNMLMNMTSSVLSVEEILKRLVQIFKGNIDSNCLESIAYLTEKQKCNLDGAWLLHVADGENVQDMQNESIRSLLGFSNSYNNVIVKEDDIVPLFRLNQINKGFIYQHDLGIKTISTEAAVKKVIDCKIGNYLAGTKNDALITFENISKDKQIPNFAHLIMGQVMTFDDFLEIRNNFDGQLFRKWFESVDFSETETRKVLMSSVKSLNSHRGVSLLRWFSTTFIGVFNTPAGVLASAVDSFVISKMLKGDWHPNLFLDDKLTKNINKVVRENQNKIEAERKVKYFGTIPSRNDKCPCLSGSKFKNCCGIRS